MKSSFQSIHDSFSLNNQLALITGGGSGIGYYIAEAMVKAGARVIITGRREEALQQATTQLGSACSYQVHDITDRASIPSLIASIEANDGPIDILVNNAGINMKKPVFDVSDEDFDHILQTNLQAVFSLTRECGRYMVQRQHGCIIMITSMAALYGIDRVSGYTASKAAVGGLIHALTTELGPYQVRVNGIAPGFIETPMMLRAMESDPPRRHKALDRTPMGRWGTPEDIGWSAVFLASPAARFITGITLPVDGGNAIGF